MSCNICEETFQNIKDLMTHKKKKHSDRVALCWKFAAGHCSFGDTGCWFNHGEIEKSQESSLLKCNLCDKEFQCQTEVLKHRKNQHSFEVMKCRNQKDGKCTFGSKYCWFIHDNHKDLLENDHSKEEQSTVIQKVFGRLEKLTKRIMEMEQTLYYGSNENEN